MYSCQQDATSEPSGSCTVDSARRKAISDRVRNGVRGLADPDVKGCHFTGEIARSYCRADVGQEDTEVSRNMIDSAAINWSRTVKRLIPLAVSG